MRGAATADVMTPLRNSYEGDDYDRHDQDELDATAGVVIALAALVPLRLCVELLRLSAPGAVLLAVQSLKALELRAPALGHGAAGGLFNALARHSPALQSLTMGTGSWPTHCVPRRPSSRQRGAGLCSVWPPCPCSRRIRTSLHPRWRDALIGRNAVAQRT